VEDRPILIVTGLSGSGKSTAIAALEDVGYFCVDNLPIALLPGFLDLQIQNGPELAGFALGMDLRDKGFLSGYGPILDGLRQKGFRFEILFLEAEATALVRRYSTTRRQHPLAKGRGLASAIEGERQLLQPLRLTADRIIDSSRMNVHELKAKVLEITRSHRTITPMQINIISFGFKHGTPPEADMLMDVRFLANPYFVPELKELDGESAEIRTYILDTAEAREFVAKVTGLMDFLIPLYEREGKANLNIAVGCTGGRHRSVTIARTLFDLLSGRRKGVELVHRDINLPQ
jgi:RNase adapter protein RapZ